MHPLSSHHMWVRFGMFETRPCATTTVIDDAIRLSCGRPVVLPGGPSMHETLTRRGVFLECRRDLSYRCDIDPQKQTKQQYATFHIKQIRYFNFSQYVCFCSVSLSIMLLYPKKSTLNHVNTGILKRS